MANAVGIIGAGIAGIASAIRLSKAGCRVTVLEQSNAPGGKISQIQSGGYRFDTGPSLLTLPEWVDELYDLCNEDNKHRLPYSKLDSICRYFYPSGKIVNSYSNPEKFAAELEQKVEEPFINTMNYLTICRELYDLTAIPFIFSPFGKISNLRRKEFIAVGRKIGKLDAFRTLHHAHTKYFKKPETIQLFDRYATYNGSNPYKAPATLKIIAHLEHDLGAYFPQKGMYSIIEHMHELAKRNNVDFIYNSRISDVKIEKRVIRELHANTQSYTFNKVLCNMDIFRFYKHILKDISSFKKYRPHQLSSSAIIFHWGINRTFDELALHNILFSQNYESEFSAIFSGHFYLDDPTIYIYISSKLNKNDAPDHCENWFVMINAPSLTNYNTDEIMNTARNKIQDKINRIVGTDISQHITCEHYTGPKEIESRTSSFQGALYGSNSNNSFSAFLRHPNHRKKYTNLYFAGGSVHPGGGIPLCLASAKIVSDIIQ